MTFKQITNYAVSCTTQSSNPKSKLFYDEELKLMVNQEDKSYGVSTNEKSFKRGVKANNHISNEVKELCEV